MKRRLDLSEFNFEAQVFIDDRMPKVALTIVGPKGNALVWVSAISWLYEATMLYRLFPANTLISASLPYRHGSHEPWMYEDNPSKEGVAA